MWDMRVWLAGNPAGLAGGTAPPPPPPPDRACANEATTTHPLVEYAQSAGHVERLSTPAGGILGQADSRQAGALLQQRLTAAVQGMLGISSSSESPNTSAASNVPEDMDMAIEGEFS